MKQRAYSPGTFIPQWEPLFNDADADAVFDCVRSTFVNEGQRSAKLEKRLAEHFGTSFCVLSTSGTMALFMALKSVGVGPGDEVIVPDITFAGTADSAMLAGARVVCVDVCRSNWTIDVEAVESAISPKTKAVVPVHLNGHAADLSGLENLCCGRGIHIIEDCAQAIGSRDESGAPLGSRTSLGAFSLASTKIITCGQGGFILGNDSSFHSRLVELKDHGRQSRKWNHHPTLGFNFKLTDLQAALALSQLETFDERIDHMKTLEDNYRSELAALHETIEMIPRDEHSIPWQFEILFKDERLRQRVIDGLQAAGIGTRLPYEPLHRQVPFKTPGTFPVADFYSRHALFLPSSPILANGDVIHVCNVIKKFL